MTLEKRKKTEPVVAWITAMILCPLGISFSIKSAFGVSMIEAPVYILFKKISTIFTWYTYGTSEYLLQAVLLIAMCIAIRKFRFKYLLSFATAFVYGWILDGWNWLFDSVPADTIFVRIIFAIAGCLLVSFSVALFFKTWLPLEIWELFVKEVSEHFGFSITKCKWVYDLSSLAVGIILMLVFFGKFDTEVIGIGTVVITIINAPLIGFFGKMHDKFWNGITKG